MTFLKGRAILWILIPAAFAAAFLWEKAPIAKPDFIEAPSNPDYYLTQTQTQEFDINGNLQHQFSSQKTLHFKETMRTEMHQPTLRMLGEKQKGWKVIANHAVTNELSEELTLTGDVNILLEQSTHNTPLQLTMPSLLIDFASQTASTEDAIILNNGLYKITATGMDADLQNSTIEFKSQVVSEEL